MFLEEVKRYEGVSPTFPFEPDTVVTEWPTETLGLVIWKWGAERWHTYDVTHAKSGRLVGNWAQRPRLKEAKEIARRLGEWTDWTVAASELRGNDRLNVLVGELRKEFE